MKNRIVINLFTLLLLAAFSVGCEGVMGWKMLATHEVDYTLDHDVVDLTNAKDAFTSLKVVVKDGSVNMHKATVHFADGDKLDVELPSVVTKENDENLIDLKGNDKVIEKVTFWYDTTKDSPGKATIEVYGRKA